MKSHTDLKQSKKLAEILPLESADMGWNVFVDGTTRTLPINDWDLVKDGSGNVKFYPCWSLAALLEYMNRNFYNISLNYCGSEYTISFDDSERYKTITKDYSIDAAFEMVIWLKENNRL